MTAQSARRASSRALPSDRPRPSSVPASRGPMDRSAREVRRQRQRHLRRRRRDLLEDVCLAIVLTIGLIVATAGLGVVVIIDFSIAAAMIASVVLERRMRNRAR